MQLSTEVVYPNERFLESGWEKVQDKASRLLDMNCC